MQTQHPLETGVITQKTTGSFTVQYNGQALECSLSTDLRKAGERLAIGDFVRVENGFIQAVLPRRNQLSRQAARPTPGAHAFEQVIAANVDQVVPVFAAANPAPHWNLLDRYLVTAEAALLPVVVVITKQDLVMDSRGTDLEAVLQDYQRIGYPVIVCSAQTGVGMEAVRAALRGKLSVLLGKSGVGKTSLLNTLQPRLGQRVGAVSQATGKGRHTTTVQQMFALEMGGAVIDTPGTRAFGLWDLAEDDLGLYFPEIRPHVGGCRFGLDCRHDEEPGCAVRKAVLAGQVSPRRYQSYLRLQSGD